MLIVGGVIVSLAGCSEKVDDGKVEDFLLENAQVPALIESIDCPSDVEFDEGSTFECEVHTRGGGVEVTTVRQVEDEDVCCPRTRQVRLPEGQDVEIIPENVEALISEQAPEPDRIVSIDCPSGIPIEQGRTFRCVVRFTDGTQTKVAIVQRDDLGNVELKP